MAEGIRISELFARAVYRRRRTILFSWVAVMVLSSPLALDVVLHRCVGMSTKPVKGSASDVAFQSLKRHFKELTDVRTEKVEIRCVRNCEDLDAWRTRANQYVEMLQEKIDAFDKAHPGSIIQTMSYFDMHLAERMGMHSSGMESMFLSIDGRSILFTWIWAVPQEVQYDAEYFTQVLADFIEREINTQEVEQHEGGIVVSLTGIVTLSRQMFLSIVNFFVGDLKNAWMNILVLAFALKDLKLTFLALVPMVAEIPLGIGLIYFVSLTMDVPYLSALMCLQMITAMGWDYSLFTLTRYASERANGLSVEDALVTALTHSSPLILISGIVLTISWSALFFMPEMFQAFAACAGIGVLTAALANATLLPALLAIFPFFGPAAGDPNGRGKAGSLANSAEDLDQVTKAKQFMHGCYYTVAKYITRWPCNVILIISVYIVMMPFTIRCFHNVGISGLDLGHSYELTLPRGREEWSTALRIQKNFHPMFGVLMPTTIFATNDDLNETTVTATTTHYSILEQIEFWKSHQSLARDDNIAADPNFFEANCRIMNELVDYTAGKPYAIKPNSLFSPSIPVDDGTGHLNCLTYAQLDGIIEGRTGYVMGKISVLESIREKLSFMWKLMGKKNAMLSVVNPSIDPLGPEAFKLMDDMRTVLDRADERDQAIIPGISRMMYGGATYYMDNIKYSERQLPKVFLGCSLLCFLLVALNFRAVFIPAKLFVTVIWPITWFFGIALMVYEDGMLEGLGIPGLAPTGGDGLDWTVPMFSVTFMIGVALDYDYFLFERVYEFRKLGFGDCESIQLGLSAQAVTITAGGLILSFTFFSMITESLMPVTNQLGFMYFAGILIDTFLVRTIVTPALLSLHSWINYWPVVMSEPIYEWLHQSLDPRTDDITRQNSPGSADESDCAESKFLLGGY